ncbi:uncharacterized protein LOC113645640 isoform X1 [Tachysurus fulvidraco]|uniref:uncharacterized protein LOC113645640 isoform X1 n=1 Tax=Tachysurus fulvidraco TaxID=1234273 RepID=UPI000F4F78BC|nr:uncharacterized protein LOC113645640 isoform X1 [Tachysurus fulvidraco]
MSSGQLLCLLLALPFCSTNTSVKSITVSSGGFAFLPYTYNFTNNKEYRINVKCEKDGKFLCKYLIDNNISNINLPECTTRIKVNKEPLGLNITDVESSDAGNYTCVITKSIPPPTEVKSTTLLLKVIDPPSLTLELMNSTNSSCVELLCSLQGLIPQQVNFTWTRAAQLLHYYESNNMSSFLMLCKPNWTDGETLTCRADYSVNHTLYSRNIKLPYNSGVASLMMITAVTSTCAGLLLFILLGVAIFKWKKRDSSNGAVVYRNKIYENFTLSNATVYPTLPAPRNAQPVPTNIRNTTRSTPHTIMQTQREECIYEN